MIANRTHWGNERLQTDRAEAAPQRRNRSKTTNGTAVVVGADGRSVWQRRFRDLVELHISDLGGQSVISQAEYSIVRRAATLTVELEKLEARFADAEHANPKDLDLYQRTAGNLRRLLESVGLKRRAKDITPSLQRFVASRAKGRAA